MSQQPPYNQEPNNDTPQQPHNPQQPYTYNMPPPGYQVPSGYQQPMQQPKKRKKWPLFVGGGCLILVVAVCGILALSGTFAASKVHSSTDSSVVPTSSATGKWTTTHTFTGTGAKKTASFTAPDDWKIIYTCQGMSTDGLTSDANLIVGVNGSDGSIVDPAAINTICKAGKTSTDSTEEHSGGNVYLDVNGEGAWTLQVQEMK